MLFLMRNQHDKSHTHTTPPFHARKTDALLTIREKWKFDCILGMAFLSLRDVSSCDRLNAIYDQISGCIRYTSMVFCSHGFFYVARGNPWMESPCHRIHIYILMCWYAGRGAGSMWNCTRIIYDRYRISSPACLCDVRRIHVWPAHPGEWRFHCMFGIGRALDFWHVRCEDAVQVSRWTQRYGCRVRMWVQSGGNWMIDHWQARIVCQHCRVYLVCLFCWQEQFPMYLLAQREDHRLMYVRRHCGQLRRYPAEVSGKEVAQFVLIIPALTEQVQCLMIQGLCSRSGFSI